MKIKIQSAHRLDLGYPRHLVLVLVSLQLVQVTIELHQLLLRTLARCIGSQCPHQRYEQALKFHPIALSKA